jgi:hypothetical protein
LDDITCGQNVSRGFLSLASSRMTSSPSRHCLTSCPLLYATKNTSLKAKPESLIRSIEINAVDAGVFFSAAQEKGNEPRRSSTARIERTGTMDEPIRDTRDVEIVLYAADDPKPGSDPTPWIGLVHGIRPVMRAAIFIPHRDFDRLWSLGLSGLLKHARIVLTPPRYQSAHVLNISFSTHLEE